MTAELLNFLRARLDEDEQAAMGASAGPWAPWRGKALLYGLGQLEHAVTLPGEGVGSRASIVTASWMDAEHIARHDPARVLADVEAKRRLLAVHKRDTTYSFSGCITCDAGDNSCGCMGGSAYDYPCETLRILALPYAAHPDYRTEWAPDSA